MIYLVNYTDDETTPDVSAELEADRLEQIARRCAQEEDRRRRARIRLRIRVPAVPPVVPVHSYHLPEPRIARGWLVALALAILGTVAVLHSLEPASMIATGR